MNEITGQATSGTTGNEIAVIGMAGRFPGAGNVDEFWENLKNGVESIGFASAEELEALGVDPSLLENPGYVKCKGGVMDDIELFDASFFGYTPGEAEVMDPQQRLFHECAWEALENAGCDSTSYKGLIGLYAGASSSFQWEALARLSGKSETIGAFAAFQLFDKDFLSTRIAYKLNLQGPAVVVQTTCSTSLVAIHLACQSILDGECDMALAGGVSIDIQQEFGYLYQEGMIYSPDGHCRAFDAGAKGCVEGNGVGIVVLKALEDALSGGDHIHAVVKGTAINNDGINKAGYTAPSRVGQTRVIRMAHQVAEVKPGSITYVEAHGTGTVLGDPIEMEALKQAFNTDKQRFCAVGSVKTNIGHLDAAAGVAGFIKTVLALKNKLIPPSLNFQTPNPKIDLENSPFYVNAALKEWECEGQPLRAGVSSFGLGGTNAHVILEEAPGGRQETPSRRSRHLVLLSARTETALEQAARNLVNHFKKNPGIPLADATYTLQTGRKHFKWRQTAQGASCEDIIKALSSPGGENLQISFVENEKNPVVFMFPGQGAQYVNMGLRLYKTEPVFREELDRCFEILKPIMGYDIKDILYPPAGSHPEPGAPSDKINQTGITQPVIFSLEYALAMLLMNWGVQPYAMIGHSIGEYTAACLAGVFSLEDALTVVAARGRLMQKMPSGSMLSVPLPEDELEPLLQPAGELALAAVNGPSQCVVSGPAGAVENLVKHLEDMNLNTRILHTSHAFHSKMMDPILPEFEKKVKETGLNQPGIPYISNVTGQWMTGHDAADPRYWSTHLRHTVRFSAGVEELLNIENPIFIEIGPGKALSTLVRQHKPKETHLPPRVINLVRHPKETVEDDHFLLNKMGRLWLYGWAVDWAKRYTGEKRYRVPLPPYPFERQRYWIEADAARTKRDMLFQESRLRKNKDIGQWFYAPSWERTILPPAASHQSLTAATWLVFTDGGTLGEQLAKRLETVGAAVITVGIAETFEKKNENRYTIAPAEEDDYHHLFAELKNRDIIPGRILHLWGVTPSTAGGLDITAVEKLQDHGFYSLLYIARALGRQFSDADIQVGVVTNHMQEVTGEETLCPGKSTVLGAVKVIPLEHSHINCSSFDILLPPPGSPQEEKLAGHLLAECAAAFAHQVVAYRGKHRWVGIFKPMTIDTDGGLNLRLKPRGVYLITGDPGGIGLTLAEHLAQQVNARLILVGRSPLPDREEWENTQGPTGKKLKKLLELEKMGTDILPLSADIADMEQMRRIIRQSEKHFGPIDGVIHCAGLPDGAMIQLQTRETSDRVLKPKVTGTLVLEHLLKDRPPDFVVYCSSISSILEPFGQAAYCAANAFLDAFAHYKNSNDTTFTVSINWDTWQEVGAVLKDGIRPPEGIEVFNRILGSASSPPQVVVSTRDLGALREQLEAAKNEPIHADETVTESERTGNLFQRPRLNTPYAAPQQELEQQLTDLWQNYFGIEPIGIHDDFFELGGDSLKALALLAMVHKKLDAEVPLAELFNRPTIKQMARYVQEEARVTPFTSVTLAEKQEYYPLSSAQKRLYILHQMEPDNINYNMPLLFTLGEDVDMQRLALTFKKLAARHESLRTSFEKVNEIPVQKIHDDVNFEIEYHEADREKTGEIVRNFARPFDLGKAPLLRSGIVKMPDNQHVWMIDMHHIISDGTSQMVLTRDFLALYDRKELPPLTLQYKDFSQWQNELFRSGRIKKQEGYWLDLFSDDIPKSDLLSDYPRPTIQSFEGDSYGFKLSPGDTRRFKEIGSKEGVTLFINLLTVLYVLLYKYTGQEDIIVGSDISGRPHADLQEIIGMFVNMLAMRNFPLGRKTYREFLAEVKENSIKAFENQDMQFEELVDKLDLERDPSRNPLFDIEFVVQNYESASPVFSYDTGIDITQGAHFQFQDMNNIFDISLDAIELEKEIFFNLRYCSKLFKRRTMERFGEHYINILKAVSHNPGIRLSAIDMSSEREKKQVLFEFNDTGEAFPHDKCYFQLFEEQAQRTPDRVALEHNSHQLSYKQLNEKASRLARYLYVEKETRPGCLVGIWMERSIHFAAAVLGVLKAGGAYVPIEPALPEERIKVMIRDGEIGVVISQETYRTTLDRLQWECQSFHSYLCIDGTNNRSPVNSAGIDMKEVEELWNYVGETAADDIAEGGWFTSYTGEPFSSEEMAEYGDNVLKKLLPLLNKKTRVLEIGCASGLTMYRIAPHVQFYCGTDISKVTIEKNKKRLEEKEIHHIALSCLPAHEVDKIAEKDFDIVIINSVIQSFPSHDYLRSVLRKAIHLLKPEGFLFAGDVMDQELKEDLINEMIHFKKQNKNEEYKTKIDWSSELFISRGFFEDLLVETPGIEDVEFSGKIYTIENELTKFRYDALIKINKSLPKVKPMPPKQKYQDDLLTLQPYGTGDLFPGDSPPPLLLDPDNLAYVIYTSGTTGNPKGAMIHHRGMINHIYAKINDLSITAKDIIAQTAPAGFDISVWQFLAGLLKGASVYIFDKAVVLEHSLFLRQLRRKRVTVLESVPSLMTAFLEAIENEAGRELTDLRWMIPTGESLPVSLVRTWYRHYPGIKLLNAYGPTEASDDVTHHIVETIPYENQQTIPIGKPLQNLHIYIMDKDMSLCPVGVKGEICTAGVGVGKGYWKDKRKTEAAFIPNPYLEEIGDSHFATIYKTGDTGYFRDDGSVECLGRMDYQVKIRGNRIELGEIERHLLEHEEIKEAVVLAREDRRGDKHLCTYIVPHPTHTFDTPDLREYLARDLAEYMIPSFFVQLEQMPLTANGKVNRKALPDPEAGSADQDFAAPRNKMERTLAEIWAEVLGIDKENIGIDSNFFQLGGHSITATILVSKIHKVLNIRMPLAGMFVTPTIRGSAETLKKLKESRYTEVEPVEQKEYYPLSPAHKRLYILQQWDKSDTTYNVPMVLAMEGEPDRQKLEMTFLKMIRRHESFRTSFVVIDEEPVQRIHDTIDFSIAYYRETPTLDTDTIIKDFVRAFDLSRPPLFRVGIIKTTENHQLLMVDMHHIITDGASEAILAREFTQLYEGAELPPLTLQYKDFSEWQNRLLASGEIKKQEEYWLERFRDDVPVLNLPGDYPASTAHRVHRTGGGSEVSVSVQQPLIHRVHQVMNETDTTLFMILLAIFTIVLSRYARQEDIVVGSPITGRRHADLQNIIGMFVNMLAMRNRPEGEKTFQQFLLEVKENVLAAYENQDYQFDELVRKLGINLESQQNPLFNTVLAMQNVETGETGSRPLHQPKNGASLELTHQDFENDILRFGMTLFVSETTDSIFLVFRYANHLFKKETIETLGRHFVEILEQVTRSTNTRLKEIALSSDLLFVNTNETGEQEDVGFNF